MHPRKNVPTAFALLSCLVAFLASPLASAAPTYKVTVAITGDGEVTMSPETGGWYAKNNIVTLTAVPTTIAPERPTRLQPIHLF